MGQSKMDNPEKLVQTETQHILCIIKYIGIGALFIYLFIMYYISCIAFEWIEMYYYIENK
jgi:hypothetical protein